MNVHLANPTVILTLTAPTLTARIPACAKLVLPEMGQLAQVGKIAAGQKEYQAEIRCSEINPIEPEALILIFNPAIE